MITCAHDQRYQSIFFRNSCIACELAYQRSEVNRLRAEVDRLKRGEFTEAEFQFLCHNLSEDDERRFKRGCLDYQNKLFGGTHGE